MTTKEIKIASVEIASVENADKRLTEIPNLSFAISAKADYYNGLVTGFKDGYKQGDVEGFKQGYLVAIRKACKWLEENFGLKHQTFIGLQGEEIKFLRRAHLTLASTKELLADFKKDMEEQL